METSTIPLMMMISFCLLIQFKGMVFCQVYYDRPGFDNKSVQKHANAHTRSGYFFSKKTTNTSKTVDQCGFHNFPDDTGGDYPWSALILYRQFDAIMIACNGNLISNRHIVTAAYCVTREENTSGLSIVIGKYDIQNIDNAHRYAIKMTNINDQAGIAALTLSEDVEFKTFIRPICLWTDNANAKELEEVVGTVSGWKNRGTARSPWMPQHTEFNLTIVRGGCYRINRIVRKKFPVSCAEPDLVTEANPCVGVIGSGFMIKWKGRWALRGVIFEPMIDDVGVCQTVLFSNILYWSDWILNIINV